MSDSDAHTFSEKKTEKSVFRELLKARTKRGGDFEIVRDADDRILTYNDIVKGSLALGARLSRLAKANNSLGVMLPTGAATVVTFFALTAFGRVPAMLNFTSGVRNLKSALKAANVDTIITARRFVEVAELESLIDKLSEVAQIVYLEDEREAIGAREKLIAATGMIAPGLVSAKPHFDDTAVILFTSGTEGAPKGVALSHKNLVSNVQQIVSQVPNVLKPGCVMFTPLPTFHCFGLMGGILLPVLHGLPSMLHPSPLHVKEIPKRIAETKANLLFTTDTFLNQYLRAGKAEDLRNLDYAVCGAERVKDETRHLSKRVADLEVIEGYGVTETSPVLAVNNPLTNRPGTVGAPLAGIELMLEPVTGINDAGRLHVRGPNIMKGYLSPDQPGLVQKLDEGWHDTGDVVSVDDEGFISIRGRMKRFAKLGGEMVSLTVVENCAYAVWPDHDHAAAVLPDSRKGEQVVLLSTNPDAERADLNHWIQNHGVSELSLPKKIFYLDEIPLLATGKMDIGAVQKLAADFLNPAAPEPTEPSV